MKISDGNYHWLSQIAGKLQHERGMPVSLDSALTFVHKSKELTSLAGAWQMQEKEAKKSASELRDHWTTYVRQYLAKQEKKLKGEQVP